MSMTTRDLVLARAREHMAKNASFMSAVRGLGTNVRRVGSGVSTRISNLGSRVGGVFRRKPDVSNATRGVRDMLTKDFEKRLRDARIAKIKQRGKGELLRRLQAKARPTVKTPTPAKKGLGLGKKMMIGAGLLAAGATMAGGASAARERARQPLAPPEMVPPGY